MIALLQISLESLDRIIRIDGICTLVELYICQILSTLAQTCLGAFISTSLACHVPLCSTPTFSEIRS